MERGDYRRTSLRGVEAWFLADVSFRPKAHLHHLHCQTHPTLNTQAGPLPPSSMNQGQNLPFLFSETLTSKRKIKSSRRD